MQTAALEFRLNCVPPTTTAQHKGAVVIGGQVRFYTKKEVRQSENLLASLLMPHVPAAPFDEPVSLIVAWTFPYRRSEPKRVTGNGVLVPHTSRPDLDNLEKSLLDVMTRLGFWTDDSLVARKATSKCWGAKPGIDIRIEPFARRAAEAQGDLFAFAQEAFR